MPLPTLSTLPTDTFSQGAVYRNTLEGLLDRKKALPLDSGALHNLTFSITLQQVTQILSIIQVSQNKVTGFLSTRNEIHSSFLAVTISDSLKLSLSGMGQST